MRRGLGLGQGKILKEDQKKNAEDLSPSTFRSAVLQSSAELLSLAGEGFAQTGGFGPQANGRLEDLETAKQFSLSPLPR